MSSNSKRTVLFLVQNVMSTIALLAIPQPNPIDYGDILQPPSPNAIIYCIVRNVSSADDFTTRWFVNTTTELHASGKYIMNQGKGPGVADISTVLVIHNHTYEDAGNYTCLVTPKPPQLGQSSFSTQQLVLPSKVDILNDSVDIANVSGTSPVMLWCEMFRYIRPDSSLLWYHDSEGPLTAGSKYDVRYFDGTKQTHLGNAASRISILTISNFTSSDLGNYTCRVGDEYASTSVRLKGNAAAQVSQLNGNSKPSFRISKDAFEQQRSDPAVYRYIAASSRLESVPPLIIILLVLCCM